MKKWIMLGIVASLIIILNSSSFGAFQFKAGAKGGVGVGLFVQANGPDSNPIFIPAGGGFIEFAFKGGIIGIGFEIGFMYEGRGGEASDDTEKHNYFALPLMVKVYSPFIDWFWLGVGVSYQRLLNSNYPTITKKDNLELLLGIGVDIPITNRIGFVAEARGYIGLINYSSVTNVKVITGGLEFLVGISVRIF